MQAEKEICKLNFGKRRISTNSRVFRGDRGATVAVQRLPVILEAGQGDAIWFEFRQPTSEQGEERRGAEQGACLSFRD